MKVRPVYKLIVSKNPVDNIYTTNDYGNYAKLMLKTNNLHHNNDPNSNYPPKMEQST